MGQRIDLTGQRFGRLTVLRSAGNSKSGHTTLLRSGATKSCGCLKHEYLVQSHTTHSETQTRLYNIWAKMRGRCARESDSGFENYGGRGITVCMEWQESYEKFRDWALSHGYKDGLTIDRKDNNGPYSPENCRWADAKQQARNRRSNNVITFNGETRLAIEWDEILGFSRRTVSRRVKSRGWSVERALTEPIHAQNRGRWSK